MINFRYDVAVKMTLKAPNLQAHLEFLLQVWLAAPKVEVIYLIGEKDAKVTGRASCCSLPNRG
jgi:hypothetical protein